MINMSFFLKIIIHRRHDPIRCEKTTAEQASEERMSPFFGAPDFDNFSPWNIFFNELLFEKIYNVLVWIRNIVYKLYGVTGLFSGDINEHIEARTISGPNFLKPNNELYCRPHH